MKAAILGMGTMGQAHRLAYDSLGYEVKTYDPKDDPPEQEGQVIEWADIVSICSPDNFHVDQFVKARRLDKIVFCEKPFCHTRKQLQTIECYLRPRKVGMNFPLRWHRPFVEAKQRIGDLGEIYLVEADYEYGRVSKMTQGWRGKMKDYDIVMGGGIHMIDVVRWIFGSNTSFLSLERVNGYTTQENVTLCTMHVAGVAGAVFKLTCDFGGSKNHARRLRICGTKDSLYIDDREPTDKVRALREFLYCLQQGFDDCQTILEGVPTTAEILRVHEIGLSL